MHERALMADLVRRVLAVATAEGAGRVEAVEVRLGALSHFTPAHFREHFRDAAAGTAAAGAKVAARLDTDPAAEDATGVRLLSVRVG